MTQTKADNADAFSALLIDSIENDNIELVSHTTVPKEMLSALQSTQRATSGTCYYYIRQLMTTCVEDDFDAILEHLSKISKVEGCLRKLCEDGKLSIDDLEVASLTALLPASYSTVTSSFERQESVTAKDVADAVRNEIITCCNLGEITVFTSSSANVGTSGL